VGLLSRKPRRRAAPKRRPGYFRVDGFDLRAEMLRLCRLPVFGDEAGPLASAPPQLTVRRATRKPRSSLGFAVPDERRISVTAYPGVRRADLEEVLLHELVHVAVGRAGRSWHGAEFKRTLKRAMREGYGVSGVAGGASIHGAYADAIERRRRRGERRRAAVAPQQLAFDDAA
jgi:hypothetical protein